MLVNDSKEAQKSAVDRSVLAVRCRVLLQGSRVLRDVSASASMSMSVLQCVAVYCSMLQCVANVLQCVAGCCCKVVGYGGTCLYLRLGSSRTAILMSFDFNATVSCSS